MGVIDVKCIIYLAQVDVIQPGSQMKALHSLYKCKNISLSRQQIACILSFWGFI